MCDNNRPIVEQGEIHQLFLSGTEISWNLFSFMAELKSCMWKSGALQWEVESGGLVVSYRTPSGPAGRRRGGWSARLRPAWRPPRWGR